MRKLQTLQPGDRLEVRLGRYVDLVQCDCIGRPEATPATCPKCGGTGAVEATAPAWGPWIQHSLHVQRDNPKRGTPRICTIALIDVPSFAEFDPRQDATMEEVDGEQVLCLQTEDYYLQIKGVEL